MIVKERSEPLRMKIAMAFERRLPVNHPKKPYFQKMFFKSRAGYKGELAADYYLDYLPENNYWIFKDLRLPDGKYYFQIDTLIITPQKIILLEIKNMIGTLIFDQDNPQLIQIANEEEKGYSDPISQSIQHQSQLKKFLACHRIPNIPIEYLVVISNLSSVIKIKSLLKKAFPFVCKADNLLMKIYELESKYKGEKIDIKTIGKIKRIFLKAHTPPKSKYLQNYGIPQTDLLSGVICPACKILPMNYQKGVWCCLACKFESKDAHIEAVRDYYLLIKPTTTNKEIRDFLHLPSQRTAAHLLKKLKLPTTGTKKGTVYHQPPDLFK